MARMRTAKKSSDRNSLKSSLSPITEKGTKHAQTFVDIYFRQID